MINEIHAKQYCKEDISRIENYQAAIADKTQTWDIHHRNEISENKTKKQLIAEGRYWLVSAKELIFLTSNEHISLHRKGKSPWIKGKHHTEEARQKISEALSGEKSPLYGKHLSEETRQKMSEAKSGEKHPFYGQHRSVETRQKQSAALKGSIFWNNGIVNKRAKDCPGTDWKRGRIKKGKNHENN